MHALRGQRGFTLIELLVVIAIIGMLSSIVLASMNSARDKGRDAAIKAGVRQLATAMELNYSTYGSYTNLQSGWDHTTANCNDSFAGDLAANARQICGNIVAHTGTNGMHTGNATSNATHFSIMAWLPGQQVWYCAGSSGGTSAETPPANQWVAAGCYNNP